MSDEPTSKRYSGCSHMSLTIALPISTFLPNIGGAEVGVHNIASRLLQQGHRPVVIASHPYPTLLRQRGWQLPYPVQAFPPRIWGILERWPWLGFLLLDRFFALLQRRWQFDYWHVTMGYPVGVAFNHFAACRPDIAWLVRCAGDDIQIDRDIGYGMRLNPVVDQLVRRWLPLAQHLVAISDSVVAEYRALGVAEEQIVAIPNGVDLSRFQRRESKALLRQRLGLPEQAFLFLSVGRHHPKKNFVLLLQAVALLKQRTAKQPFMMVIAGGGVSALLPEAKQQGVADHLSLHESISGHHPDVGQLLQLPGDDLVDLYLAADAFVFPSRLETFGIVLAEAMAAGLPIITSDAPGCRDLVRHGRDGLVVNPNDAQSCADAMALLMSDSTICRGWAERSQRRGQDFCWDNVVGRYLELYQDGIKQRRSRS
ncbi:MAG: glycosyltransferase family 4 protein [Magnetococcales bacterium]|nr:glycosyltransferase family 4 protein [Magnetococcales bacterium]